ncbi:MAG TPA: sigma 54-interacting transcriptional regulator [bacterium]|nr:sigma 54-interacting transcriptional regulator [bacterium]
MVSKTKFYQEIATKLMGELQPGQAFWECFHFIQQYMPLDSLNIYLNPHDSDQIKQIAHISAQNSKFNSNISVYNLPNFTFLDTKTKKIALINNPSKNSFIKKLSNQFKSGFSSIVMATKRTDRMEIILILQTKGLNQYKKQNLELLKNVQNLFYSKIESGLQYYSLYEDLKYTRDTKQFLQEKVTPDKLIGLNSGLKSVDRDLRPLYNRNVPILIEGKIGVEKKALAHHIHQNSWRSNNLFLSFNCSVHDSKEAFIKLFGRSNSSEIGLLEYGRQGTIFMNYIDHLDEANKKRVLVTLRNGSLKHLSNFSEKPLDIRLICTFSNNPKVSEEFREFAGKYNIEIPPLKDRTIDIPNLLEHYTKKISSAIGLESEPKTSSQGLKNLMEYDWPGNLMEFKAILQKEILDNPSGPLIFAQLYQSKKEKIIFDLTNKDYWPDLESYIKKYLQKVVDRTQGQIEGDQGAAQILQMHPNTLRHRLKKYNIQYGRSWQKNPEK